MWSVTFQAETRRSKSYKTENGALKAIWKWLKSNQHQGIDSHAILIAPGNAPERYDDWQALPFTESKQDFYQSGKWLKLRVQAFELYGNRCACCGITPAQGATMHVDHIKPRSKYPQLALDIQNLQILCEACNKGKSNYSETKWRN
ncbi:HNH endonuclease [Shewanella fidelis]|uniref:HNH endonuclease n=1 Tax=Shewanella fidelis TaxID=173509 RepID=UPI0004BBE2EA|nr:HNH endonuclease signature motif containing protein [Shewanella fidelis]